MNKDLNNPSNWKYESSTEPGFHTIISPENSACKLSWIYRLNMAAGEKYDLYNKSQELNAVVISGKVKIMNDTVNEILDKKDSFYLPGGEELTIEFLKGGSIMLGGSLYEGKGVFFTRKYDLEIPLGDIRQVHGSPPYRRDVFMTLSEKDLGSRLICGITTGDSGLWTSWPPHQHTLDLEEVYCYFDIPDNSFAFHFCSRKPGEFEHVHSVKNGDCVIIPEGYHPTLGMPGVKSNYFWVMAAHKPESRRYDLAVNDPMFSSVK